MTSRLVLQINSLDALERLIGGDTEVEVELRNNIAAKFCEKHLKQLANTNEVSHAIDTALSELKSIVRKDINDKLAKASKVNYWLTQYTEINADIQQLISNAIEQSVGTIIKDYVKAYVDQHITEEKINAKIDRESRSQVDNRVAAEVKKRLDSLLNGLK